MRKELLVALIILLTSQLFFCGCAVNQKFRYHNLPIQIRTESSKTIALAVLDKRYYVMDGSKTPNYTGLVRGGFGNPFNAWTESGNALAADFASSISNSMSKAGLDVQVITVTPKESMLSTRDKLVSSKRDRLLLIVVDEWYHDTTVGNIELNFNVVMHVLNAEGVKLGESSIKGLEIVGSNMWNPVAEAYDRLPVVFEKKFEHLFNQQEIERALE